VIQSFLQDFLIAVRLAQRRRQFIHQESQILRLDPTRRSRVVVRPQLYQLLVVLRTHH
jgi:hypothetical protein